MHRKKYYKRKSGTKKIVGFTLGIVVFVGVFLAVVMNFDLFKQKVDVAKLGDIDLTKVLSEVKSIPQTEDKNIPNRVVALKVGVISDSHGADELITKAVGEMKTSGVQLILHLGDFSEGGEMEHFQNAKDIFESSGIPYQVLPGDHDFNWVPNYSRENYEAAFGSSYNQSYVYNGVGIVMFENSLQLTGNDEISWLKSALLNLNDVSRPVLFFSARPLYSPYFPSKQDNSGEAVISLLKDSGVGYAFAGDTHIYARYKDLSEALDITTVGAVGEYKNPLPQWVLVVIYDDGSVDISPQPLVRF